MRSWYAARPRRRVKMVAGPSMPNLARFIPSLPTLDLTGALDILLVAFVVYEALTVVRGTRAGHILIGILTMVSIYALASWTGLEALRSLLSFIVPYIGLAIIVLFQSEIRRTLARIGRKNWFGLAKGFRAPEALSEIMMATEHFSLEKIGALIVLERDIGLRTAMPRRLSTATRDWRCCGAWHWTCAGPGTTLAMCCGARLSPIYGHKPTIHGSFCRLSRRSDWRRSCRMWHFVKPSNAWRVSRSRRLRRRRGFSRTIRHLALSA